MAQMPFRLKSNSNLKSINFKSSAPLCPKPPKAPDEGVREHLPLAIPVEPIKECYLDSEVATLTCHSFLNVYVTKVSYGRNSETGAVLCDGDKPNDFSSLGQGTCYNDTYNTYLKDQMGFNCHGTFNCTYQIPTVPLTTDCDGLRRETKIEYICGEYIFKTFTGDLFFSFCS